MLTLIGSSGGLLDALKGRVDFQHLSKDVGTLSVEMVARKTVHKQIRCWLTTTGSDSVQGCMVDWFDSVAYSMLCSV